MKKKKPETNQGELHWDKSAEDSIERLIQNVLDSPRPTIIDFFKEEKAKKFLSYDPIAPSETKYYEGDEGRPREVSEDEWREREVGEDEVIFTHITEVWDLTEPEFLQEFLKEIRDKINGWLKRLIPKEKYKRLFENFTDKASIHQMIEEELEETIRNDTIDSELRIVSLACIHGAGALQWLLHEAPLVFPQCIDSPGFKDFCYNYNELIRLLQSNQIDKGEERKQEIFRVIEELINDPKDPVPLRPRSLAIRLRTISDNAGCVGNVHYERDEEFYDDATKGRLFVDLLNGEEPIKYETFRQYVRAYKKQLNE
jgi:hypothetical protein